MIASPASVAPSRKAKVLKFGGSSLASADRLRRVLELVAEAHAAQAGAPLALVVSAIGDSTDLLLAAAGHAAGGDAAGAERLVDGLEQEQLEILRAFDVRRLPPSLADSFAALRRLLGELALARRASPAALDEVMSYGERTAAELAALLLTRRGLPAVAVDARRWTVTDDRFGDAAVDRLLSAARVRQLLPELAGQIAVHTGFLGATRDGRTTTLGRNGSDYTAALLARFLDAGELTRWTDVSGIMTADPALVPEAYTVPRLSYDEALELSSLGWRVLHPRTLLPLIEAGIPLRIRNSLIPGDAGTLVDAAGSNDADRPTCVTSLEDQALLSVEWRRGHELPNVGERVLRALDRHGLEVYLAVQQPRGRALTLALPGSDLSAAKAAIREELQGELACGLIDDVSARSPVSLLTLVAEAMGRRPNVAGRFYGALGALGIQVRAASQGAAMRSVVAVVDGADTAAALRTVHAAFNLADEEVSLFVLGKGVVGSALLGQIEQQAGRLPALEAVQLRVAGLADSQRLLFSEAGLAFEGLRGRLAAEPPADPRAGGLGRERLLPVLDRLARLPAPILIDVTAADGMEGLYGEALQRGIHLVASNKKPLALPQAQRDQLLALARRRSRAYLYETTVGASLPVIETLKNLVRTGDRVRLIEGSLSGTLGFLAGQLMAGVPLSVAVRDARDRGFTEPHPGEDLSGRDAARKALILARELGYPLDLSDVRVEPLAPPEVLAETDLDRFFVALARQDKPTAERVARIKAEGKVLRYLARIEANGPQVSVQVGPIAVAGDHLATRLRGSESLVAFTSDRYSDYPLTVQGAGAGGAVTAAGVLADVLRVAQTLRGR